MIKMMHLSKVLTGKVALVAGGSRGIGRAVAMALTEAGAQVAVNYRIRVEETEAVCAEVESQGGKTIVVHADVSIAEAGIHGLTHSSYASLLAKEGITINAIAPALIETEMTRANPRARPDLIPVGRLGAADEVADVVVLLAQIGYITGQTINVNGGRCMISGIGCTA
jgi:NAD(P)-dependent dehydrogenase (short-subunit alcohol dehydrogenase family)